MTALIPIWLGILVEVVTVLFVFRCVSAEGRREIASLTERYERELSRLTADNLDLRNRLFTSKGQPPTGVDLTAQYQEKKVEQEKKSGDRQKKPDGPLEQARKRWADDDLAKADKGIDLTKGRVN